jgi:hypothetical protein
VHNYGVKLSYFLPMNLENPKSVNFNELSGATRKLAGLTSYNIILYNFNYIIKNVRKHTR